MRHTFLVRKEQSTSSFCCSPYEGDKAGRVWALRGRLVAAGRGARKRFDPGRDRGGLCDERMVHELTDCERSEEIGQRG